MVINQVRHENNELLSVIARKDDEMQKLKEFFSEQERRRKQGKGNPKEVLKVKKHIKDKEREIIKLTEQLKASRAMLEDQRVQLEEALATGFKRSTSGRPQTANINNQGDKQLREELSEKDEKIKELNRVLAQLQDKLQEKSTQLQAQ